MKINNVEVKGILTYPHKDLKDCKIWVGECDKCYIYVFYGDNDKTMVFHCHDFSIVFRFSRPFKDEEEFKKIGVVMTSDIPKEVAKVLPDFIDSIKNMKPDKTKDISWL